MRQCNASRLAAALIGAIAIAIITIAIDAQGAWTGRVPQIGRYVLAIAGLVCGGLLVRDASGLRPRGWQIARLWLAVQIPYLSVSIAGASNT
jgi:hypothetical protein